MRRIKQRLEFELSFQASRVSNKWFIAYARKNGHGYSRLGLVVSKKIMPKAVLRNYAKRLVREVFRKDFPANRALDVVIRPRRPIVPESREEEGLALKQLFGALQK